MGKLRKTPTDAGASRRSGTPDPLIDSVYLNLLKKQNLIAKAYTATLSSRGNPRLQSLVAILQACNLHISIRPVAA